MHQTTDSQLCFSWGSLPSKSKNSHMPTSTWSNPLSLNGSFVRCVDTELLSDGPCKNYFPIERDEAIVGESKIFCSTLFWAAFPKWHFMQHCFLQTQKTTLTSINNCQYCAIKPAVPFAHGGCLQTAGWLPMFQFLMHFPCFPIFSISCHICLFFLLMWPASNASLIKSL